MDKIRQIKQLQSQLAKEQADADALKIEVSNKQREHSSKVQTINRLRLEIAKLETPVQNEIHVSEHALIRYLERVKGIDISVLQSEIITEKLRSLVDTLGGTGTFPVNGFQVKMKNNTVVTII